MAKEDRHEPLPAIDLSTIAYMRLDSLDETSTPLRRSQRAKVATAHVERETEQAAQENC